MDEVTLAKESYNLVRKDFGLEDVLEFGQEENDFDRLEDFLTKQVNYLLDNDLKEDLPLLHSDLRNITRNQIKFPKMMDKINKHYKENKKIFLKKIKRDS